MDNREKNRGTVGNKGGRPSKSEEALEKGVEEGNFKYVQMFYNYYAGKPKETKDITISSEQPLFDL